jgi:hypothetical protein
MFSLALALDTPVIYASFDNVTRILNLADLISHLAGLIGILLLSHILSSGFDLNKRIECHSRSSYPGYNACGDCTVLQRACTCGRFIFSEHYQSICRKGILTLPALNAGWCY